MLKNIKIILTFKSHFVIFLFKIRQYDSRGLEPKKSDFDKSCEGIKK